MKIDQTKSQILSVQMPSEEYQKYLRDKKIEYHRDVYGFANSYDNILMLAGYGAFFALWAAIADDVTQATRAITVVGLGISLLSYIIWQLTQMLTRQQWEFERSEAFDHELQPDVFNELWDKALEKYTKRQNREIRLFWPITFGTSVILGIGAGVFLVSQAIAIAFGWPQFTGNW